MLWNVESTAGDSLLKQACKKVMWSAHNKTNGAMEVSLLVAFSILTTIHFLNDVSLSTFLRNAERSKEIQEILAKFIFCHSLNTCIGEYLVQYLR